MVDHTEEPQGDEVFKALADPSRRQLLDRLNQRPGQNLTELCAGLDMARQSVTKHLAILERAGLIVVVRHGRERLHHLNAAPINDIADRWIGRFNQQQVRALADLKTALEAPVMTTQTTTSTIDTAIEAPSFTYTTYIKTTPEQLWLGLTDPVFTEQYWGLKFHTDWAVGSTIDWEQSGVTTRDPGQVVVEYDPYHRLAYTWHTFTPEWGAAYGVDESLRTTIAAEPRSTATFELEPSGEMVRLTVVHSGFAPGSTVVEMVGGGWPKVLSVLKTLLETGATATV
ncbi:MAG: Transcriptional regulator, ArsR family [Ilumatobacteraceae bacterium]|nr:Transcriptional regulator, ArsR family [Ilumatobacteraceae bacterium]